MKLPVRAAIDALRPMSRFFIERPRFAAVVSLVLAFLGLASLRTLPVAQYPEVMPPAISIDCCYPGANTHELMTTVANVIEDEVNGVEGMLYMDSTMTDDGGYNLAVTFDVSDSEVTPAAMICQLRLVPPIRSMLSRTMLFAKIGSAAEPPL